MILGNYASIILRHRAYLVARFADRSVISSFCRGSTLIAHIMAQAVSSGATKRATRKTKSTRNDDFLYHFGLPPVPFASAMDRSPSLTGDTKTVETPLIGIEALTSQQKPLLDGQASTQNDQLAQRIILVQAEREKLALELELLRLKYAKPPTLTPSTTDTGTSAAAAAAATRHVDWPQDFSPGMSTNVEYDKLDLSEFVAGYLSMIKTYVPESTKFILTGSHLKLLMIKRPAILGAVCVHFTLISPNKLNSIA